MDGKRAAIYTRISRDEAGTGQKVEDQEKDCRELAACLGLDVVEVFTDNDIAATRASRRGRTRRRWYDLLDAIRAGQVDVVLATEPERVQREMVDLLTYIDVCRSHNVLTYTVRGGSFDLSNPDGIMTAQIVTATKQAEAEKIKQRARAARVHKVGRGEWVGGRRPFGYEADGMTVIPKERDALQRAAATILTGGSLNAACADLNKRKIRTSTDKEWKPTELRRVLLRPRNAGLSQHRVCGQEQERGQHHHTDKCVEIVGKAQWPPLLDEDVWRGVVAVLKNPARRTNTTTAHRWLMSGRARCGICGDPIKSFSAHSKKRRTGPRPVYTCSSNKHVIRNAAEVDAFVEAVILERLQRPDAAELLAPDRKGDTAGLHLRDAALQARLEEYERLAGTGEIDPGSFVRITADIRRQREEITDALGAMTAGSVLAGVADAPDPAQAWKGLDLSRKRAIVSVLIDVVILPAKRGRPAGWRPGETYFDPARVEITWRR
jgi:DNA invertase Pin-like site-specific DNA recombinase